MKKITKITLFILISIILFSCDSEEQKTPNELVLEKFNQIEDNNQFSMTQSITHQYLDDGVEINSNELTTYYDYQKSPYYLYLSTGNPLFDYLYYEENDEMNYAVIKPIEIESNINTADVNHSVDYSGIHRITDIESIIDNSTVIKIDKNNYTFEIGFDEIYNIEEDYFLSYMYSEDLSTFDLSSVELVLSISFDDNAYSVMTIIKKPAIDGEQSIYTTITTVTVNSFEPIDIYNDEQIYVSQGIIDYAVELEINELTYISSDTALGYYKIHFEPGHYTLVNHDHFNTLIEVFDSNQEKLSAHMSIDNIFMAKDLFSQNIYIEEAGDYYILVKAAGYLANSFKIEKIDDKTSRQSDAIIFTGIGSHTFTLSNEYDSQAFYNDASLSGGFTITMTTEMSGIYVYYYDDLTLKKVELTGSNTFAVDQYYFYIASDSDEPLDVTINFTNID